MTEPKVSHAAAWGGLPAKDASGAQAATRAKPARRARPETPNQEHITDLPTKAKTTRITVDLDASAYTQLNQWLYSAAIAVDPDKPRLSIAQAIRAMICASIQDEVVAAVVLDLVRRENARRKLSQS